MLKYIAGNEAAMKTQAAAIKNLENQMGQLVLALNNMPQGTLPSDTEKNPRGNHEQCNAITLRSGKKLGSNVDKKAGTDDDDENEGNELAKKSKENGVEKPKEEKHNKATPLVPFPQRLESQKIKDQFSRFMDIFKAIERKD